MRPRVVDRIANLGPEFDDRLVHLGLDLLLEQDLATLEDFLNVRLQLARLRIDNRKLLFDTEGVGVLLLGHWSPKSLSKTWRCHPESPVRFTSLAQGRLRRRRSHNGSRITQVNLGDAPLFCEVLRPESVLGSS